MIKFIKQLFKKRTLYEAEKTRNYLLYCDENFKSLEFNILTDWEKHQNDLEIVFSMTNYEMPQLFVQTVGKTDEFKNVRQFFEFAQKESDNIYSDEVDLTVAGYPAIEWLYEEADADLCSRALAIDVGPGIIWFYLKSKKESFANELDIFDELKATFKFGG